VSVKIGGGKGVKKVSCKRSLNEKQGSTDSTQVQRGVWGGSANLAGGKEKANWNSIKDWEKSGRGEKISQKGRNATRRSLGGGARVGKQSTLYLRRGGGDDLKKRAS